MYNSCIIEIMKVSDEFQDKNLSKKENARSLEWKQETKQ